MLSARVRRPLLAALGVASVFAGFVFQVIPAGAAKPVRPNLTQFYNQKLVWTACGEKMQCSWLTVPRSYLTRNPHGTFRLRLIKDPATGTPAQYEGPLVMNPGGPGGSGVQMIAHHLVEDPTLHAAYDFVSFDPRGVGDSLPAIDCKLTDKQLNALDFTESAPRTAAQQSTLLKAYSAVGKDCDKNDANVIKWVDTASAARDIDMSRGPTAWSTRSTPIC